MAATKPLTALKPGWRVPEEEIEGWVVFKVAKVEGLEQDDEGFDFGD